jgi:endo-1,4-beta-xylanase
MVAVVAVAIAGAPAEAAQTAHEARAALYRAASSHDRVAARYERLRKGHLGTARRVARLAKRASRGKRKDLHKAVRTHRRRARRHGRKARWHRREARRLRRLAAGVTVAVAAAPAPQPRRAVRVPLGTAVFWTRFVLDGAAQGIFHRQFDQMTPENELKMHALQPTRGNFDFETADEMVDWAIANGKRVRGHTLVYGSQLPWWITARPWTRAELLDVMEEHIKEVVGHFRGRIGEWDVVNEAVGGDGSRIPNVWQQVIGDDYVEKAFRFAREADPGAKLYYNEGGIDLPHHPRTQAVRALLADLRSRGVPVDGVGMQNHMTNRFYATAADVAETMRRFGALGLEVAVTEMDVQADLGLSRDSELQAQAGIYEASARACRMEPSCTSFTTWGTGDAHSWLGAAAMPLMFDTGLNAKPAFYAVADWLRNP